MHFERGADVFAPNANGRTPRQWAVNMEHERVVQVRQSGGG
jgi:ankyrin repeat protein